MSDQQTWTHIPTPGKLQSWQDSGNLPHELLSILLDIIQDGLCIIDRQMNVVYSNVAMQYWYGTDDSNAAKCYERFHRRTQPCPDCPALRAFTSGTPQTSMQAMETKGKVTGQQRLFCVPLLDEKGDPFLTVEYVRDISNEKMAESTALLLEEQNAMLQEHLQHSQAAGKRLEEETTQKLNYIVNALKQSLSRLLDQRNYQTLEKQIDRLLDTFADRHSSLSAKLSEQEQAVAGYIMEGYVSKEIAEKLNLSKKTVDFHRTNIRKKMGLGPGDNLRQRLKDELY